MGKIDGLRDSGGITYIATVTFQGDGQIEKYRREFGAELRISNRGLWANSLATVAFTTALLATILLYN
jgi:hypothetical protein